MENCFSFSRWDSCCARKTRFSHAAHARARIRRIRASGGGLSIGTLVTYKCQFCSGFHIGHDHSNHHSRGKEGRIL
jgi:hypothetical protein